MSSQLGHCQSDSNSDHMSKGKATGPATASATDGGTSTSDGSVKNDKKKKVRGTVLAISMYDPNDKEIWVLRSLRVCFEGKTTVAAFKGQYL